MANQPTAVIYFNDKSGAMAKDLAARVRNDGVKTLMIWAHQFSNEDHIEESARAVIIQASAPNADLIRTMYESFAAGVEIHLVDDEGEFLEGDALDVKPEAGTEPAGEPEPAADQQEPEADAADAGEESGGGLDSDAEPEATDET